MKCMSIIYATWMYNDRLTPHSSSSSSPLAPMPCTQAHVHSVSVWKLVLILAGVCIGTRGGGVVSYA